MQRDDPGLRDVAHASHHRWPARAGLGVLRLGQEPEVRRHRAIIGTAEQVGLDQCAAGPTGRLPQAANTLTRTIRQITKRVLDVVARSALPQTGAPERPQYVVLGAAPGVALDEGHAVPVLQRETPVAAGGTVAPITSPGTPEPETTRDFSCVRHVKPPLLRR